MLVITLDRLSLAWFGMVWGSKSNVGCHAMFHEGELWVPLRVRQRMTEREAPLSSHRPSFPFLTKFAQLLPDFDAT